jgi:hypothetical protein
VEPEAQLYLPWLVTALAALAVPWLLYLALPLGTVAEVLAPKALIATTWPVLVGAALAWMLARWGTQLPKVPAGDVAVVIDPSVRAAIGAGALITRLDTWLRQWATTGVLLLSLGVALLFALVHRVCVLWYMESAAVLFAQLVVIHCIMVHYGR